LKPTIIYQLIASRQVRQGTKRVKAASVLEAQVAKLSSNWWASFTLAARSDFLGDFMGFSKDVMGIL